MLNLITPLLLAATCLLVSAGTSTQKTTTCEGNHVHRLFCDYGVISVETALYGRTDAATCSEGRPAHQVSNTKCSQNGVSDILKSRCDGKRVCELSANTFSASDPCRGTYKYLQTEYNCIQLFHLVTCEHSVAHLTCDEGMFLSVFTADYGRYDQTTCSYNRPPQQIQNICSNPTSKVAESCNGKNSCTIKASNSVFGDPCHGIYKYLQVAYKCEYPQDLEIA